MATMKNQQHQYNAEFTEGETVTLYVNGTKYVEFTVSASMKALVTFMYQEIEATAQ